jgi:hypothetical protein
MTSGRFGYSSELVAPGNIRSMKNQRDRQHPQRREVVFAGRPVRTDLLAMPKSALTLPASP